MTDKYCVWQVCPVTAVIHYTKKLNCHSLHSVRDDILIPAWTVSEYQDERHWIFLLQSFSIDPRVRRVLHFQVSGKQQEEHVVCRILGGRLQMQTNATGHKVWAGSKEVHRYARAHSGALGGLLDNHWVVFLGILCPPPRQLLSSCEQVTSGSVETRSTSRRARSSLWSTPCTPWPTPCTACTWTCVPASWVSARRWTRWKDGCSFSTSTQSTLMVGFSLLSIHAVIVSLWPVVQLGNLRSDDYKWVWAPVLYMTACPIEWSMFLFPYWRPRLW